MEDNNKNTNNEKTIIEKADFYLGLLSKILTICGLSIASIVSIGLSIYNTDKSKNKPTDPHQTISPSTYNEKYDSTESSQLTHTQEFLPVNPNEKYIQIKAGTICLNVRDRPNTVSTIITQIPEDETYMMLEQVLEDNEVIWYKIEIDESTQGYVAAEFVNVFDR